MNRYLLLSTPLCGLLLLPACTSKSEKANKPLNIVYIMTDDHTQQMMSCYDQRFAHTPHLDRIAQGGVRFTNSFVCNSISGPSRAVLLTGKHSHKNGKLDNAIPFDGSQQTVQKLLQEAGYQTAIVGKWHLASDPTGFDFWKILPGQGDYYNPRFLTPDGPEDYEGYVTNVITDMSIDWMAEQRDREKPFCLFVHHKAVHRNWMSDTKHLGMFEDKEFELPANFFDDYAGRLAAAGQEMSIDRDMDLIYDLKMYHPDKQSRLKGSYTNPAKTAGIYGRMTAEQKAAWDAHYQPIIDEFYRSELTGEELAIWKYQRYMKDYLKTVQSLDENVGRLLDYLEQEGLMENTLIVYTSDQGFYMGEHGWFDKRFMYEESMRTPLVMHLPEGFARRGDVEQLVQNIDYTPTFLELAGVAIPEDIQGESLLPLFREEAKQPAWRESLYYHFYEYPAEHAAKRHYGIRTERYKLIHFYNDIDSWELYDLREDPMEMNNLYGKEGYDEVSASLHTALRELQERYDDPIRFDYP